MPLMLGGPETERSQLITYDPAVAAEVKEALDRRTRLLEQGYRLKQESPGEVLLDPPPKDPNVGVFRVLSQNGDDRIVWDRTVAAQVKEAFKVFKELLAKGYSAYVVLASGRKGHKVTEFDPSFEEVLMVPATCPG